MATCKGEIATKCVCIYAQITEVFAVCLPVRDPNTLQAETKPKCALAHAMLDAYIQMRPSVSISDLTLKAMDGFTSDSHSLSMRLTLTAFLDILKR
jgi:hypothetical protein